ncbi:unnamed protein product [Vitrella brassicaformis CCMP3155]|uniref:SRP54-type proteins GTP-binding domain-containing protein n=2 Tax=Vitrella brassicaformis TaxID=1169539 RepID=A0A0G4GQY1_VITBC|nr:unnamed protein product [Vitrella brassicaformis CCMP3155]|eukprot:CEM32712.1 unnamed protein product [Vitrella brassicaformis CCMP3155]
MLPFSSVLLLLWTAAVASAISAVSSLYTLSSHLPSFIAPLPSYRGWHTRHNPLPRRRATRPYARRPTHHQPSMILDFIQRKAQEDIDKLSKVGENLQKFQEGLSKSRDRLLASLSGLFGMVNLELEEALEQLEEILLSADIGTATTADILTDLRATARGEKIDPEDIKMVLRGKILEVLRMGTDKGETTESPSALRYSPDGLTVWMVMGANGMGKTTTIGKLAARLRGEGKRVLVAACDTFRAAAVDQLEEWANRAQVDIHRPQEGETEPWKVVEAALDEALTPLPDESGRLPYDVMIVDTAGRLANNVDLNEELEKMVKVTSKRLPAAPAEILLVVDASIGRNAVEQARIWQEDIGVTGLVVTKLDGTARAGFVVSVVRDLNLPVKLVGVGEKLEDLRDFDAENYVDALFGYNPQQARLLEERMGALMRERAEKEAAEKRLIEEQSRKMLAEMTKGQKQQQAASKGGGGDSMFELVTADGGGGAPSAGGGKGTGRKRRANARRPRRKK